MPTTSAAKNSSKSALGAFFGPFPAADFQRVQCSNLYLGTLYAVYRVGRPVRGQARRLSGDARRSSVSKPANDADM